MRYWINLIEVQQKPTGNLYFLRNTVDPERDLERGFSCHIDGWRKTPEKFDGLKEPIQDPHTKLWCVDPELGLSSFAFWDEVSFDRAMERVEIYAVEPEIAVFQSSDYDIGVGCDGEDVFRDGEFIGWIGWGSSWTDVLALVVSLSNQDTHLVNEQSLTRCTKP